MGASVCFLLLRKVKRRGKVDSFFGTRAHKNTAPAGTGAKENTMNDRQTITLDDTDKLNQEYALWLAAGVSPELLTPPSGPAVDLFVRGEHVVKANPAVVAYWRARDARAWRHCQSFVRINGTAYEVDDSSSEDEQTHISLSRPTYDGGRKMAECPDCPEVDHYRFTYRGEWNGTSFADCDSCGRAFQIEQGIPTEHKGEK